MGKSDKSVDSTDKDSKILPGPGSYTKPSTLAGPKWRFGSSKRNSFSLSTAPGPGTYQIKSTVGNSPPYVNIPG